MGLVGSDGEVATRYSYDPFGNTTVHGEDDPNPFTYTGRELDETGLLYHRARYYSPRHARFISQDPIGFAGGDPNLYAYASNNPTTLTDPTGLRAEQVVGLAVCGTALSYAIGVYVDNVDEFIDILDTNGDGRVTPEDSLSGAELDARTERVLTALDLHNRENLVALELAFTICSVTGFPGFGGLIGKGATSFGRAFQTRFPNLAARVATRFPNAGARFGLTANPLDDLAAFRASQGLPIAGSADDVATTARLEVGGQSFYGRSAHGRPVSIRVNPQTATHAEADVFQQALDAGASGRTGTMYVDRVLCKACGPHGGIGSLMRGTGVDELTLITPEGRFLITASRPSVPIPLGTP